MSTGSLLTQRLLNDAERTAVEAFLDAGVDLLTDRGVEARRSDVGALLDAFIASDAMKRHDAEVRAEALLPVRALAEKWKTFDPAGNWRAHLTSHFRAVLAPKDETAAERQAEAELMHAGQCSQMCEDHPETCAFSYRIPSRGDPHR